MKPPPAPTAIPEHGKEPLLLPAPATVAEHGKELVVLPEPAELMLPALVVEAPARAREVPAVSDSRLDSRNPVAVYLAGKPSAAGRRGLQRSLNRATELFTGGQCSDALLVDWPSLRYQHIVWLRAKLLDEGAKPATINLVLAAVRGTIREAWRLGLIDAEAKERICDVGNVKASTLPAGRHVDTGEIRRLFQYCADSGTLAGARDAAMLTLLYGCGVRRSEAAALELDDYEDGAIKVRHGKGRKERMVYPPAGGRAAVDAWIERRGTWPGPLLCPIAKGNKLQQRGMTDQALMKRLSWLAKKAGVTRFSPHDLRRSFVGELLDNGADISSVQQLAGHTNVATTQRYDRRPEDVKRRTAELLNIPYVAQELPLAEPPAGSG